MALVAAAFLVATAANAQTRLLRADVAAADTVKIRIDVDLCPNACLVKQAVITRDGLVRRTARVSATETIIALDTIRVSPATIDSMTHAIAAAGFDTLKVPRCDTVESDARHVTVTVARGRTRRSVRVDENCRPRYKLIQSIETAIEHVASLSAWSPPPRTATAQPPSYLMLAGCYLLGHGAWQGPTINRIEPPSRIQLGLEPGMGLGGPRAGYFSMSPWLPFDVARGSGFALWRPAGRGFDLLWGDGFTGITATLTMQIDSYAGTGKVHTDVIGIENPSVPLSATRVKCEE